MCVKSLGFCTYKVMSSVYSDNFTSFFPIWMAFISFSCLSALVKTSSTMLNSSGEWSSFLCSWSKGKTFSLSLLKMLAVDYSYMALSCWGSILLFLVCWIFVELFSFERMLNCVKCVFYISWDEYVVFVLYSVNVVFILIVFNMLNQTPCTPV